MAKFNTTKILLILSFIYLSILFYTIIDLIRYRDMIKKDTDLFKNTIINSFLKEFNEEQFRKTELETSFTFYSIILFDFTIFVLVFILNLVFYKEKSRKYIIDKVNKLLRFINLFENETELNAYSLLVMIFIFCFLVFLTPEVPVFYRILVYLCYICILICNKDYYFDNHFEIFKAKYILVIASFIFLIDSTHNILIICQNFKNFKGIIPPFLKNESLKLAVDFFKKENIYYILDEELNMMTSTYMLKNILYIKGGWGIFSDNEIASIIAHEIGHGDVLEKYFLFFCDYLIKTVVVYLFLKATGFYVKNIKSKLEKTNLKSFFVYLNLYILYLLIKLFNNTFSQMIEYHADKMVSKIYPKNNFQKALFKLFMKQRDVFYVNKLYLFFKKDHPSIYHRIIEFEKFK